MNANIKQGVLQHVNQVQAILFDVNKYTEAQANAWLGQHGWKPIKPLHSTARYHRARIQEPDKAKKKRTITFGKDIKAIVQS